MKYCKQRDRYSCGAIAVLNATKWLGWGFSSKDLNFIKATLGTTRFYGTLKNNFDLVARKWLGARRLYAPDVKTMEAELKKGRSLLVREEFQTGGHYYFIDELYGESWRCINYIKPYTAVLVHPTEMAKEIKRMVEFQVWSLGRDESPWLPAYVD